MHDDAILPSDVDTTIQCDEMSNITGNKEVLPLGAVLSIACYLYLFWMYYVVKSPILMRHPTELAIFKCIFDILYIQQYMWLPFFQPSKLYQDLSSQPPYECNASLIAGFLSFISQFSLLGSELCFLVISVDLRVAYTNPFSSFKENRVKYAIFILAVSIFMGFVLILCGPQIFGLASEGIVWVQTKRIDYSSNYFTEPNYPKFFLLYFWNVLIYVYCIWASFQYSRTYAKGLSKTLSNRLNIMQRSRRFTLAYIAYDTITLGSEFLSFLNYYESTLINSLPAYFYSFRGVASLLIIMYANKDDLSWRDLDPLSVFRTQTSQQREHDLIALESLLLQPHLNAALRVELLYFATQGIMHAARDYAATEEKEREAQHRRQLQNEMEVASTMTEPGSAAWRMQSQQEDELRCFSFDHRASGMAGGADGFRPSFYLESNAPGMTPTVPNQLAGVQTARNQVPQSVASDIETTGVALRPFPTLPSSVTAGTSSAGTAELTLEDISRLQRAQAAAVTLEVEAAIREFALDVANPLIRPSQQGIAALATDPELLESILKGQSARESLRQSQYQQHRSSVRQEEEEEGDEDEYDDDYDEDEEEEDDDQIANEDDRATVPTLMANSTGRALGAVPPPPPSSHYRASSIWSRFSFVPSTVSFSNPTVSSAAATVHTASSKQRNRWFSFAPTLSRPMSEKNSETDENMDVEFSMRHPSSSGSSSRSSGQQSLNSHGMRPGLGSSPAVEGLHPQAARAGQGHHHHHHHHNPTSGLEDGLWHRVPRRTTSTASSSDGGDSHGGTRNPLLLNSYGAPAPRFGSTAEGGDGSPPESFAVSGSVRDRLLHSLYTATQSLFVSNNPMVVVPPAGSSNQSEEPAAHVSPSEATGAQTEPAQATHQSAQQSAPQPAPPSPGNERFTKDFRFQDYAPRLFATVRRMHDIDTTSYINSFVSTCRERFTEGRSGAFMFYSIDERCIVKTTSKEDIMALRQLLPAYVDYLQREPHSLLCRFLGAHCLTMYGVDLYFVVMLNLFPPQQTTLNGVNRVVQKIAERYDLKGSWVNRHGNVRSRSPGELLVSDRVHGVPLLMDNDLLQRLSLRPRVARRLATQIHKDVTWLMEQGRMDYSLLIGVKRERFKVQPPPSRTTLPSVTNPDGSNSIGRQQSVDTASDMSMSTGIRDESPLPIDNPTSAPSTDVITTTAGQSVPPQIDPFERTDDGAFATYVVEGAGGYFVGLIDVLQGWTWKKQLERFFKVYFLRQDPAGLSAIGPIEYASRFYRRCVLDVFDHLEDLPPTLRSLSAPQQPSSASRPTSLPSSLSASQNLLPQLRRFTDAPPMQASEASSQQPKRSSTTLRKRKKKKGSGSGKKKGPGGSDPYAVDV